MCRRPSTLHTVRSGGKRVLPSVYRAFVQAWGRSRERAPSRSRIDRAPRQLAALHQDEIWLGK